MTEQKQYEGGCHCGTVRYEAQLALEQVIACNCSVCQKRGSLLTFVPSDKFKLLSGEGELTEYLFNQHKVHHLFCKRCGILSFATGTDRKGQEMRAINVRCLDGVDLKALKVIEHNGRDI